jgi:5-methylcytosine-specific restriction endonuclease McrA
MKTMRAGLAARRMTTGIIKPMLTDMEGGNRERVALYHSGRWQRRRHAFLAAHPLCRGCEASGLIRPATVVDHVDGHNTRHWRERFWDEDRWQALCADCHAVKSAQELHEWRRQAEGAREA